MLEVSVEKNLKLQILYRASIFLVSRYPWMRFQNPKRVLCCHISGFLFLCSPCLLHPSPWWLLFHECFVNTNSKLDPVGCQKHTRYYWRGKMCLLDLLYKLDQTLQYPWNFFFILNTLFKKFLKDVFVASTPERLSSQEFMGYLKTALLHTFLNYV